MYEPRLVSLRVNLSDLSVVRSSFREPCVPTQGMSVTGMLVKGRP